METLTNLATWIYNYSTDFCINMSYLLGIDYVTFGSLFFAFFMNGIILILIILNLKRIMRTPNKISSNSV